MMPTRSSIPTLHLDKQDATPLHRQIYQQLRDDILNGSISPFSKLPPTRVLAGRYEIARITVLQAYEQLHDEGYVVTRIGDGTYVTGELIPDPVSASQPYFAQLGPWGRRAVRQQAAPRRQDNRRRNGAALVDFGFGRSFSHTFPYDVWRRLLARYLSTDDVMLSRYGSVAGFEPLRMAVADYLTRLRGVRCRPEQVVIVNGIQQALDLLGRLLLQPDDPVLVETPGYTDAYTIFALQGARLVPLPVDEHGCVVEHIALDQQARLAFVTPSNQFPQGGTMPVRRRLALLAWARRANALVIEDDYDGELRYGSRPIAAMQGLDADGRVLYLGTFSKVLFPALRLGYAVLPPSLVDPFLQAKRIVDRGAPTLTQAAVADFITEGHFERHLRRLRKAYGRRRELLIRELDEQLSTMVHFSREPAGLHIMLSLPSSWDESEAIQSAARAGVRVYPGRDYHLSQPAPPSVLLGFTGLTDEQIVDGIRRLAQAWATEPLSTGGRATS